MSSGFRNWSRTVSSTPTRWERPASVDQVAELVRTAASSGHRVKVVGAGHSFSAIAAPDAVALSLDDLTGVTSYDGETVRVRAGTRLHQLNAALAAHGLALPILGSIAQQSVAGAIATGTHGSSLTHGNLASLVTGMTLVDGRGEVVEVGQQQLAGARVNLGALGVVTDVRLRVVPEFRLAQTVEKVPVTEVGWAAGADRTQCRVRQGLVGAAHPRGAGVPLRPHRRPGRSGDPAGAVDRPARHPPGPAAGLLRDQPDGALQRRADQHPDGGDPGEEATCRCQHAAVQHAGPGAPRRDRGGDPAGSGAAAWDALVRVAERVTVNFIAELRFVRGDDGWLSPAYGGDVVQLGAYTAFQRDRDAYFEGFWSEMRGLGARPHWGKAIDHHTAADLAPLYPQWARFGALRDELDPERVFANRFLDRVLEKP